MIIIRPLLIMNIVVAIIIVGLNVLQNASKCTISKEKCQNFSGEGAQFFGPSVQMVELG